MLGEFWVALIPEMSYYTYNVKPLDGIL